MQTYRYGIPRSSEPPIEITWEDNSHTVVMSYKGQQIAEIDAQTLTRWQAFALPDGSNVDLKLVNGKHLEVVKNNKPLARLDSGSFFWIGLAASALNIWGVLQLIAGGFRLALSFTDRTGTLLIVGATAVVLGGFSIFAARYVKALSIRMTLGAMLVQIIYVLPLILGYPDSKTDPAVIVPLVIAGIMILLLIPALFAIRSLKV
jgi:hypothetical protein